MKIQKTLAHLNPVNIIKNPENPRIIFREDELDSLMRSIEQVGIQVPLSVYQKNKKYVLIDGERRWRSSIKLGFTEVPVIIEPEPSPLENLLMMFNIHNVRVQWDLMALAMKVDKVRELVWKEEKLKLTKKELADLTGVNPATIGRCEDLINLPKKYQDIIWKELDKSKGEQKYTEDLFIEIMKSIKTIEKYQPKIIEDFSSRKLLDVFYNKFENGVENNRVKYRDISKIARGELVGIDKIKIDKTLRKFIETPKYTIEEAFEDSVSDAYSERSTERKIVDLIITLKSINVILPDDELIIHLEKLEVEIKRILKTTYE